MPHGPFFFFWLIIPAICLIVVYKLLRERRRPEDEPQAVDEARMIQEMYRSLARMEERVETLEALLADVQSQRRGAEWPGQETGKEPGKDR
ncbi:envelope stress response membrane protein PspB [Desulfovibrio psychrotolerans]|nr:envelope stress response membrane protein PspB [Desulfovibrio psychrotolerans]